MLAENISRATPLVQPVCAGLLGDRVLQGLDDYRREWCRKEVARNYEVDS
jgi:hypothetical protein